jgi:hypothetical protein
MDNELAVKIKQRQPVCCLNLSLQDLEMWNFLSLAPQVLNTHLLFKAASRHHFDYFLSLVDFVSLPSVGLDMVEDDQFRQQLGQLKTLSQMHTEFIEELKNHILEAGLKAILVTNREMKDSLKLPFSQKIVLVDRELFGNTEPVWRQLKRQVPKGADIFLLALGEEKFLIGPRLKLEYNRPVIGLAAAIEPKTALKKKVKSFIKRALYQLTAKT